MNATASTQPRVPPAKRPLMDRNVVLEHLAILRKLEAPPDIIAIAERILREETYDPAPATP